MVSRQPFSQPMLRRRARRVPRAVRHMPRAVLGLALIASVAGPATRGAETMPRAAVEMRVESELFAAAAPTPVARSLTLFRDGVAWDFLELPAADGKGPMRLAEIVLHDPARSRVVVIDVGRNTKTQVETARLERLSVSLAAWARGEDDRLVRWAGGPDFAAGLTETDSTLELTGPRVRYAVSHLPADPRAAAVYRQFADTALLLRALLEPGGLPPFPRLALNRQLEAASAIPSEVTLEISSRRGSLGGRPDRFSCRHRVHPRLLAEDAARIDDAAARSAAARPVELAEFVDAGGATD